LASVCWLGRGRVGVVVERSVLRPGIGLCWHIIYGVVLRRSLVSWRRWRCRGGGQGGGDVTTLLLQLLEHLRPALRGGLVLLDPLAQGIHLRQVGNGGAAAVLGGQQEPVMRLFAALRQAASPVIGIADLVGGVRVVFTRRRQVPIDRLLTVDRDPQAQFVQLTERIHVFDRAVARGLQALLQVVVGSRRCAAQRHQAGQHGRQ